MDLSMGIDRKKGAEGKEGIDAHSKGLGGDFPLEGGTSLSQEWSNT